MRRVAVDDFFRYLPLTSRRDDFDRIARSRQRAPEPGNAHVLRHSLVLYDYHNGHARRPVVARSCFALIHGAPKADELRSRAGTEAGTSSDRKKQAFGRTIVTAQDPTPAHSFPALQAAVVEVTPRRRLVR